MIAVVYLNISPFFELQVNVSANEKLAAAVHLLSSIASRLQCTPLCTGSALITHSARYLMIIDILVELADFLLLCLASGAF